jgi:hypothetical protein
MSYEYADEVLNLIHDFDPDIKDPQLNWQAMLTVTRVLRSCFNNEDGSQISIYIRARTYAQAQANLYQEDLEDTTPIWCYEDVPARDFHRLAEFLLRTYPKEDT